MDMGYRGIIGLVDPQLILLCHNKWLNSMIEWQEYKLIFEGQGKGEDSLHGEAIFDIASFAFKGPAEQRLDLSLQLQYTQGAAGSTKDLKAALEAQVVCKAASKVWLSSSTATALKQFVG